MRTIGLLALAIVGIWASQGCASDTNSGVNRSNARQDAGACNPAWCATPSSGVACCINDHCGVNLNNTGCIDLGLGRRDGG